MSARTRFGATLLVAGLLAPIAYAADEGLVLRQSAERLAAAGRCDEAIPKAQRARALAPGDAQAAAIEGRCALHQKRYDAAVAPLEAARRLDPALPGVSTDLAMTHYHRGDFEAADRELRVAEQQDRDHPKVLLYRGLLHLERAEDVEAATALDRAARADAAIDPMASYYASLAWRRARERQKARVALERVQTRTPSGPWARAAANALDQLDGAADVGIGEWYVTVVAGTEWDDNVLLRGDDTSLPNAGTPSMVSNQADVRGYWSAELGAELFRTSNWAGGATVGYNGNAHVDLTAFNLYNPTASVWLDRRFSETGFFRLQPFFGYTWISANGFSDPHLMNTGGTLSYHQAFGESGSGRLYTQFAYRNYMYNTSDPVTGERIFDESGNDVSEERDRDGTDFRIGYDHVLPVAASTTTRAGIEYGRYEGEGDEYTHQSYTAYLGLQQSLPWRVEFDAEGSYSHQPYRHDSTFFVDEPSHVNRRDNIWSVRLELERPITEMLSVAGYWRFTDNDSNTPVFNYDRHILGGAFTLSFGS